MAVCATCLTGGITDMTVHAAQAHTVPLPKPHWDTTQYMVSILPKGHEARRHYTLIVDLDTREDRWVVWRNQAHRLGKDGLWEDERPVAHNGETYFHTLPVAMDLAEKAARDMEVMGRHVLDVLKEAGDE